MQKILLPLLFILVHAGLQAQPVHSSAGNPPFVPSITTIRQKLGDRVVRISLYQYGQQRQPFFINLHADEKTSVEAAKKILENTGGLLVKIENDDKRMIQFGIKGKTYVIDPNRIYTSKGRKHTLKGHGTRHRALREVAHLSARILRLLPAGNSFTIALHNNTEGRFSVNTYMPGGKQGKDAIKVLLGQGQDEDDFFLTTDNDLFAALARKNYNIILQDNKKAADDGSLSIYCGKKGRRYLNLETQHGKAAQYEEMLGAAVSLIKKED